MRVKTSEKSLIIEDYSLKSNQVSQLKFWGFKSGSESDLKYLGSEIEKILIKIIAYFQKEKVSFELSESCKIKINSIRERSDEFLHIKK